MKAIIQIDVPHWQIGQPVTIYFPDTMMKTGVCEAVKQWQPYHYAIPLTEGEIPMDKGGFRHIDGEGEHNV